MIAAAFVAGLGVGWLLGRCRVSVSPECDWIVEWVRE